VVAAVNFRGYVRPIRAFLERTSREDRTVTTRRHGESTILSAKDGMGLCFAEGTVLVSDDAESLDAVLDRAARPPASSPPATRSREMTDLASRFDVYGVMTRPASATLALHVLLGMDDHSLAEPPPGVEELTGARFGIDIVSGDLAQGLLELTYAREEAAAAAARALEGGLSEKADRLAEDGLGLRWTTQVAGPKLTLDLRFEGLTHALEKSMSEPRGRGRAP
jgi:hypothetical protein